MADTSLDESHADASALPEVVTLNRDAQRPDASPSTVDV